MTSEALYVTTDRSGTQRAAGTEVVWDLPAPGKEVRPTAVTAAGTVIGLLPARLLLEALDERVFEAEVLEPAEPPLPGTVGARAARLVAECPWDATRAAGFALDCVAHAFADEAELALPHGRTLASVVAEARAALERAGREEPGAFRSLARLAALRRLRRTRELLGDTATALAHEDLADARDLLDDPAWVTLAALGEAVLAALEALRLAVAPRYVGSEEEATEEREGEPTPPRVTEVVTPWGPVGVGAQHLSEHLPAARCATEAAERCRQAVAERDGTEAAGAERAFQAGRLAEFLAGRG